MMDVYQLLDIAKETVKNEVNSGEIFMVKDLFRGFEWNRIPVHDRTVLGSMFLAYAKYEAASMLALEKKTPQNQQRYKKL